MRRRLPPWQTCTECGRRFRGYSAACGCTENNGPGLADLVRERRGQRWEEILSRPGATQQSTRTEILADGTVRFVDPDEIPY